MYNSNLGSLAPTSLVPSFDSVRVVNFRVYGGWWKFELVRVLTFTIYEGSKWIRKNEGSRFSTQVRRLSFLANFNGVSIRIKNVSMHLEAPGR